MTPFSIRWGAVALVTLLLISSCDGDDEKIRKLRKDVRELKGASVRLTPEMDGYQVIRHDLGSTTLSLKEVKAHDKGSAITLEIGNLISAHITGATMEIGYQAPSDGSVELSSKYDVQQTLEAGKATKVTVILEGVKPSQVPYIRVSDFQPKGVRLNQAN